MTASRNPQHATTGGCDTACPPRRAFVAGDARRRGQACLAEPENDLACGDALTTPALRASVDNAARFSVIVDD